MRAFPVRKECSRLLPQLLAPHRSRRVAVALPWGAAQEQVPHVRSVQAVSAIPGGRGPPAARCELLAQIQRWHPEQPPNEARAGGKGKAEGEEAAVAEKAALLPAHRKGPKRQLQKVLTAPASDGHLRRSSGCHPLHPERLRQARLQVERAVKQRKIFLLHGPYPVIRSLLRSRGWVEKKVPKMAHRGEQMSNGPEEDNSDGVEEGERWRAPLLGRSMLRPQQFRGA
ncbi:uncharacterized protein LOC142018927 isoform X1 [Carettochelys insculpta]|uniref:uncharacterized protein LOC142018927 isoform X1 n=1 Tax=Carettochelys insculpta TaxID=44489 RepID=UPI003EBFB4E7